MMIRARFVFILLSLVLAISASAQFQYGSAWPKFRRNTLNTGVGATGGSNGLLRWSFATPNSVLCSASIAVDGTVYFGSYDGNLYAINANGTLKWTYQTAAAIVSSPAIGADGTVYVGSGDQNLYAINPDGSFKWAFKTNFDVQSSPTIGQGGTIYVGSMDGNLYAINPDGSQKWSYPTVGEMYASPSLAADGTIYVGSGADTLYAVNPDGSTKWTYTGLGTSEDYLDSSPTVGSDGSIYVGSSDANLYALHPDGTLKWSFTTGGIVESTPAIGSDGTIYFGSNDNNVYALNADGSLKWSYLTGNIVESSGAIGADGTIYMSSYDGNLYAFNPSGTVLWSYATTGPIYASPTLGPDGAVYAGSFDGNLYAIGTQVPISKLVVSPNSVVGGASSTGTVTLTSAAPASGEAVGLTSTDPVASVPVSVVIPSGQTTGSFTISTASGFATKAVLITAFAGGSKATAGLTVTSPNSIKSLTLNPTTIGDDQTSTATITLNLAAPAGGWLVHVSDEYPASVSVPATVTVPAGATSATFPITSKQFSNTFLCGIYTTDGVSGANATLTLVGDSLSGLSLNPTTVGGNLTSTGTVSLTSSAPAGGWTVNLSVQFAQSVSVPATLVVPAGASSATFTITPKQFLNTFVCGIYAADNVTGKQANLTVQGDSLMSLTLNPSTIVGGGTSTGTITLLSQAPPGGWLVAVSDEYPSSVTVPTSVTVPAGATSATFSITSKQSTNTYACGIYVSDHTTGKQANLTVDGDSLASLSFNPASVVGGSPSTGTVTLTSAAPPGGWVVHLSTEYPSVDGVPATVVVPAGALSATFTITTKATATTYGCGVYSTDGVSGKNAVLTVTHT